MQYRRLGRTGMKVGVLSLGAMLFGPWGTPDPAECGRILDAALDAGVNLVDTADVYGGGASERILGELLGRRRDAVVLSSKVNNPMGDDPNRAGNSRRWITRALEESLRRLRTDHLDLYQVHRPDPDTPIDETLGVLSDLVHQGKVRAIGTSTFPAEAIVEARAVAERRGREYFSTEQPPYSIFARAVEADVLPTCRRLDLGVLVWSPLNGGWLTGKYRHPGPPPTGSRAETNPDHFDFRPGAAGGGTTERKLTLVGALAQLADAGGWPLAHLALAFVLAHPAVTSALIGPRTPEQLADLLGAADVTLDNEVLDAIDELVAPGTTLNPADRGWVPPDLTDPALRRRPAPGLPRRMARAATGGER